MRREKCPIFARPVRPRARPRPHGARPGGRMPDECRTNAGRAWAGRQAWASSRIWSGSMTFLCSRPSLAPSARSKASTFFQPAKSIGRMPRSASSRSMDSGSRSAATRPPSAALARSSSMLVTMASASDLVEPIRPTGPRLAQPVAYRRSRTSPPSASVVMRPSPLALARWAPCSS